MKRSTLDKLQSFVITVNAASRYSILKMFKTPLYGTGGFRPVPCAPQGDRNIQLEFQAKQRPEPQMSVSAWRDTANEMETVVMSCF